MATNHQGFVLSLVGDDDPVADLISAPIGTFYQNTETGAIYSKTGEGDAEWTQLAPGLSTQVFQYECTGAEGDSFQIALPSAMSSADYVPQVTLSAAAASANALKLIRVVSDSRTINDFDVVLSAPAQAGDIVFVTIDLET